jgi:hypothetical protein
VSIHTSGVSGLRLFFPQFRPQPFNLLHVTKESKAVDNLRKYVELAANVAIIAVAIMLGVVWAKSQFAGSAPPPVVNNSPAPTQTLRPGGKIDIPEVDWQKNGQTLVLALSTSCHFCTESAPFYRQLKREGNDARLLAVFPQAASEGEAYLKKLAVPVDEVRQVPFDLLNVRGTPTLVLVDSGGEVKDTWVGKLPPNQEGQVLTRLKQR